MKVIAPCKPLLLVDDCHDGDYDDGEYDNSPLCPIGAVGALFRGARCNHVNHVCFHIVTPVIEESGHPRDGQEAPVVCQRIPQGVYELGSSSVSSSRCWFLGQRTRVPFFLFNKLALEMPAC